MDNPVFLYLNKSGLKLSVKSLSKRLKLKRRVVFCLVFNDSRIRRVNPMEVGSLARKLNVFTTQAETKFNYEQISLEQDMA